MYEVLVCVILCKLFVHRVEVTILDGIFWSCNVFLLNELYGL